MDTNQKFRNIPSINDLLSHSDIQLLLTSHEKELVKYSLRKAISHIKNIIQGKKTEEKISLEELIIKKTQNLLKIISQPLLRPVINATGIILHTNLGRAPLGSAVLQEVFPVLENYSNLEFDLEKGERGKRMQNIALVLEYLTSAEAVIAVNNNAAAIILTLNTLALNKEVIISRGELIEIGGSFRIPDIMSASGAEMVEVGTTNRTRLSDYQKAIGPNTALIFKAHQSNYQISGFTEEVSVENLANLAHTHKLPFIYDIGSGLLRKPQSLSLKNEPDVSGSIKAGADLVTFSCDKLLGGPQGGIIAGKQNLINELSKAPMMRALRLGKLNLAVLGAVCRLYLNQDLLTSDLPNWNMLNKKQDELKASAEKLSSGLKKEGISTKVVTSKGQCGGGTLPNLELPSFAVQLEMQGKSKAQKSKQAEQMYTRFLGLSKPLVAILREGRLLLDVLTLNDKDTAYIIEAVSSTLKDKQIQP